ncbi:MAG: AraC family transcriptional regulator [Spirochaetaceae bacterium]|nr:MAG: AraC family transcriptional regulator [Spirochaetaceae bacterium]
MEIKETREQKTVTIRTTTSIAELPATIGAVYGELMEFLRQHGLAMSGYPFVLYHNSDMDALDVEAGFPVDRVVSGAGRVKPGVIPGGPVLSAIHTGPYTTLEKTYIPVMEHIKKEDLKVTEWMYELYLNSPEDTPEDQLKTEICFPLES